MTPSVQPAILAGGFGTRLWPMSRKLLPKQFLPLVSAHTMLQETVARARRLRDARPPLVVVSEEHRFLAAEQLRAMGAKDARLLLEPDGRGTAPAAALACHYALESDAQALVLLLAADHLIVDVDAFMECVAAAANLARRGHLVTFGMRPAGPATGYGYIVRGEPLVAGFRVSRFVEKPDAARAAGLIAKGDAYWNSGMFVFGAAQYLAELQKYRSDIAAAAREAWDRRSSDLDFIRPGREAFVACPHDSVDYAVMERTSNAAVVPGDFGWSDLGSWGTLWDAGRKDSAGNVALGDTQLLETRDSYVRAESRMVAVLGLDNAVVVETSDAVLVATREHAQRVKEIVARLADAKRSEHVSHDRVYRPWGYYESVDAGARYQVKRIVVNPGQALSLQMHRHRAEHWVVVSGTARVTRGEEVLTLAENQSTFIPVGTKHRLENPGPDPLHIVEVQSGGYLGEDDIVRFEDRYDRK